MDKEVLRKVLASAAHLVKKDWPEYASVLFAMAGFASIKDERIHQLAEVAKDLSEDFLASVGQE